MKSQATTAAAAKRAPLPNLAAFTPRLERGRPRWLEALWITVQAAFLRSALPGSRHRVLLLRLFGCAVGAGVVIKPGVRIKFPWKLSIGDHCWLGEDCWIDNLGPVTISDNVCISQGAYLCTGNHDWTDPAFALIVKPIAIHRGAWVGAKCLIGPGVELGEAAVAAAGSTVTKNIPPFEIHAGNPASFVRRRAIQSPAQP